MSLIAAVIEDDELDEPSLRDDTLSSDRYEVPVCGFATADVGWAECVAPLGHTGKHSLPTKSVAA